MKDPARMKNTGQFKYLVSSDQDALWGITVDNVGATDTPAGYGTYPPRSGHPDTYFFSPEKGRVIDAYQLIYISHGQGTYFTAPGRGEPVRAGDLFLLRPGVWHSYRPDPATGWNEYWIGLRGPNIDNRFREGFFEPDKAIYRVGVREDIINLYERAIEIALAEQAAYQQFLAGIANLILGMTMYYDRNRQFPDDALVRQIDRARAIMRENMGTDITPEQIARRVNMSYSWFRRIFREYTKLSPIEYMQELTIQKARSLLLSSEMSIKEIAYELNFSDASYFSARFRKYTGLTPSEYREKFGAGL
jgi:AraC-like DNA-binding protein